MNDDANWCEKRNALSEREPTAFMRFGALSAYSTASRKRCGFPSGSMSLMRKKTPCNQGGGGAGHRNCGTDGREPTKRRSGGHLKRLPLCGLSHRCLGRRLLRCSGCGCSSLVRPHIALQSRNLRRQCTDLLLRLRELLRLRTGTRTGHHSTGYALGPHTLGRATCT